MTGRERFEIGRSRIDDLDDLCEFFERAYADQPVADAFRNRTRIAQRWLYLNRHYPLLDGDEVPSWTCREKGRIIGHIGAMPVDVVGRGASVFRVWWARDLILAPEGRGRGAAKAIIRAAVRETGTLFLGGMNADVRRLYLRLGYEDLGELPLFILAPRPAALLATTNWPGVVRRMLTVVVPLAHRLRRRRRRSMPRDLAIRSIDAFDPWFDGWWQGVEKSFDWTVRRTAATMSWRYLQHPSQSYMILGAWEGGHLRGIVIGRVGTSRGLPAGFITELLAHPDDTAVIDTLIDAAMCRLTGTGPEVSFTRATVLHPAFEHRFSRAGFLGTRSPIGWMVAYADSSPKLWTSHAGWYLNGGDSDFDLL